MPMDLYTLQPLMAERVAIVPTRARMAPAHPPTDLTTALATHVGHITVRRHVHEDGAVLVEQGYMAAGDEGVADVSYNADIEQFQTALIGQVRTQPAVMHFCLEGDWVAGFYPAVVGVCMAFCLAEGRDLCFTLIDPKYDPEYPICNFSKGFALRKAIATQQPRAGSSQQILAITAADVRFARGRYPFPME